MNFILILKQVSQDFLFLLTHTQRNKKGQSLIEFIMTLTFTFGIIFLFFAMAFNATDGYIVHYATFMASRTYAVIEVNSNRPEGSDGVAQSEAKRVFAKYINPSKGTFSVNSPSDSIGLPYVGVSFNFKQKFSFGLIGTSEKMNLTSESFLGREPTRATCAEGICNAFRGINADCGPGTNFTLFDNGC